ncbi:hypothetical protein BMT54_06390 [Pasteurellaceae bacterium 15-036681]|nr:hypothetical protein BMT54_06390 [Pasteurellaceae bacterium 15-036681]
MTLLLTPYFQTEVGIAFFRIPPNVSPSDFGERTLLQPAPETLLTEKSGKVAKLLGNPTGCSELVAFAKSEKVRAVANTSNKAYGDKPYKAFVKAIQTCQCRDGEYCHKEKTLVETEKGLVNLCWHHDKLRMDGEIAQEQIDELADQNWQAFIAKTIRNDLRKSKHSPIEFADLVFWAVLRGCLSELQESDLRKFMGVAPQVDLNKESTIGFEVAMPNLAEKVKPLLTLNVDSEPPASFMAIPKQKRFECRKWLQFVKAQKCVCCGARADDPHHVIGYGGKMGSKEHDLFTIPLCRIHHNELHRNVAEFEQTYGSQIELLHKFLDWSIGIGALEIG